MEKNEKIKKKKGTKKYDFMFVVALIAALLAWDSVNSQIIVDNAKTKIDKLSLSMDQIDKSIMKLRRENQVARLQVKRGVAIDKNTYNTEKRFKLRDSIATSYTGKSSEVYVDVNRSLALLNKFDSSVVDIFSEISPKDYAWYYYMDRNNLLIKLKILKLEQKIKRQEEFFITRLLNDIISWF